MVYFNASNSSAPGTEYHDITIDDPALTEYGFTKFKLPLNGNAIKMILYNDKDPLMIIYADFDKHNLDNSVKLLHDKLVDEQHVETKAGKDTLEGLVAYFRNTCISLQEDPSNEFFKNGNGKEKQRRSKEKQQQQQQRQEQQEQGKEKEKKRKPDRGTYKYSAKGNDKLHEAILLAGRPVFISYDDVNSQIKVVQNIEEATRVLKSPNSEEYPYEPYQFGSIDELQSYMKRAIEESIDSLYHKAKSIVQKFNDQDEHMLTLLAADIVWCYFQDRFSTTHYVAIVGGNGSGKTTIGDTFAAVGYRTVTMTDPSAANIFRVLGRIEYGQCTIVMDEAEKIDKSADTMNVLKSGYQFNARISKINMNEEVQQWFYPYCLKIIIAERSPNQSDAKGVLDRTFLYTAYKGKPQYDIKEILNPAGDHQRQKLFHDLVDFRKLMLIYRLIHFHDPIPDINIGLDGRDKELCKPLLQLFHNTESYEEIRSTLQVFLDAKNLKKGNLIEAALHPIIVNLVSMYGKEVPFKRIWNEITDGSIMEGHFDEKRPNEYQSADYGTLYRNTISNIICDKFGAERKHTKDGNILKFDPAKLVKVGDTYNLKTNIQTKVTAEHHVDSESSEGYEGSIEGEDSYTQKCHIKTAKDPVDSYKKLSDNDAKMTNFGTQNDNKQSIRLEEPSLLSQPSQHNHNNESDDNTTRDHDLYWIQSLGLWGCKYCDLRLDKFGMQNTPCKRNKKAKW